MSEIVNGYKEIWDTLRVVDVSEHTEDKYGLTYLSWAWAWQTMMTYYPHMQVSFNDAPANNDSKTHEVSCSVAIGECHRVLALPVMDNKNKSMVSPSSWHINTARMRCMVKVFALFGLGIYIYAGEDLPDTSSTEDQQVRLGSNTEERKEMDHQNIILTYSVFMEDLKNVSDLKKYWTDNEEEIRKLDEGLQSAIIEMFTAKTNEIKSGVSA